MIPQKFTAANVLLKAPEDHDEQKYGPCIDLPMFFDRLHGVMTSIWKPTDEELAVLNSGGGVALRVITPNAQHPPVHLMTVELHEGENPEEGGADGGSPQA